VHQVGQLPRINVRCLFLVCNSMYNEGFLYMNHHYAFALILPLKELHMNLCIY